MSAPPNAGVEAAAAQVKAVARPIKVLIPLIHEDIKQARAAGIPHFRAAGEKLLEAKPQMPHAEFKGWIKRNFNVGYTTAHHWMKLAEADGFSALNFTNLSEFIRATTSQTDYNKKGNGAFRDFGNTQKRFEEELQQNGRDAQLRRETCLRLIEVGYKALAQKAHPDKGGTHEEFVRLTAARDFLKKGVR